MRSVSADVERPEFNHLERTLARFLIIPENYREIGELSHQVRDKAPLEGIIVGVCSLPFRRVIFLIASYLRKIRCTIGQVGGMHQIRILYDL